jgi:hypothetical protein
MPSKQGRRRRHSLAEKQKGRDKNRLSLAIPITVAVAIVVLGVGLVVSAVGQRPQVAAVPGDLSIPVVTALPLATQPIPYPDVPRMTLKEATEKLERGPMRLGLCCCRRARSIRIWKNCRVIRC